MQGEGNKSGTLLQFLFMLVFFLKIFEIGSPFKGILVQKCQYLEGMFTTVLSLLA